MSEYVKDITYMDRNDFANGAELMVNITLAEYRKLIEKAASRDGEVSKLQHRVWELEDQLKKATSKITELVTGTGSQEVHP